MKRRHLLFWCLAAAVVVGAIVAWRSGRSNGEAIPITLLGYTNDVTGILMTSYENSNSAHSGFAVFRADNPTRHDFLCYIGPVIVGGQSNRMQHAQTGDFTLPSGGSVSFAVPAPDVRGTWQCGLYLYRKRHLSRLQYELFRLAER